jgi:hypothetical protein
MYASMYMCWREKVVWRGVYMELVLALATKILTGTRYGIGVPHRP